MFDENFWWGAATAAYQIEGSTQAGGRRPSIWDTFVHTPGKVVGGDTGDLAADHFRRWREDVQLMADLGLGAYRFSVSWSRVIGRGGKINPFGMDFYSRLVDELLARGIQAVLTMYHWDLPEELEDNGGWRNRETPYHFADYATELATALGDRVSVWMTLNEPWCAAFLGHAAGVHAPGTRSPVGALEAAHHLNFAHGLGARAVRSVLGQNSVVSAALNLHVARPHDPASPGDVDAARQIDAVGNRIFFDPIMGKGYPTDLIDDLASVTDFGFIKSGNEHKIGAGIDILGLNYYTSSAVRQRDPNAPADPPANGGHGDASPWVGADNVEFVPRPGPCTAMGWNIDPGGLTDLLMRVSREYPDLPMIVTENGSAFEDVVDNDRVHDPLRVDYLQRHLSAITSAMRQAADVRGYFACSLLDNFEWSFGYTKRFGIIHVDYETQQRTIKDSGRWYAAMIAGTEQVPGTGQMPRTGAVGS